jgi:hypothetical protein
MPGLDVGKLGQVDAAPSADVDPPEQAHVGDAVLPLGPRAGDILAPAREPRVKDAVQSLSLAYVALGAVGDLFGRRVEEVVCLALPSFSLY